MGRKPKPFEITLSDWRKAEKKWRNIREALLDIQKNGLSRTRISHLASVENVNCSFCARCETTDHGCEACPLFAKWCGANGRNHFDSYSSATTEVEWEWDQNEKKAKRYTDIALKHATAIYVRILDLRPGMEGLDA